MDEILADLGRLVAQFIFEFLVGGPGYLILRVFRKPEDINPDGLLVLLVGLFFWVAVAFAILGISFLF